MAYLQGSSGGNRQSIWSQGLYVTRCKKSDSVLAKPIVLPIPLQNSGYAADNHLLFAYLILFRSGAKMLVAAFVLVISMISVANSFVLRLPGSAWADRNQETLSNANGE